MSKCKVLSGPVGLIFQVLLGVASLGAFLTKYVAFNKSRTFRQFAGDASKQVAGGAVLHLLNLLFAQGLLSGMTSTQIDQCAWYLVQVVLDDTCGVWVAFSIFHLLLGMLNKMGKTELVWDLVRSEMQQRGPKESPLLERGSPDALGMTPLTYAKQVIFWVVVAMGMKISMMAIIFILGNPLQLIAAKLQTSLHGQSLLEMVVIPTLFNIVQYWLVDEIFLDAFKTESLKRAHRRLTVQHDEREQQVDNLERQLQDKRKEIVKCNREAAQQLLFQAGQFETEKNQLRRDKQKLEQDKSDLLVKLQEKAAMEGQVVAEYQAEIERLQEAVRELSKDKEEAMHQATTLRATIMELNAANAQKDQEIRSLVQEKWAHNALAPGLSFINRILRPAATMR